MLATPPARPTAPRNDRNPGPARTGNAPGRAASPPGGGTVSVAPEPSGGFRYPARTEPLDLGLAGPPAGPDAGSHDRDAAR